MIMIILNNDGYSIHVASVAGLQSFNLLVITQFWHMAPLPACNPP